MKPLRQYWRGVCRGISILFIFAGFFFGYWWFYRLAPWRRTWNHEWISSHSRLKYWREIQKSIYRHGWLHDNGFTVGAYGDKSWMEWLIGHIQPGTRLDVCYEARPAHADTALRSISNQGLGEDADAWLAWWEKNKSKTQEQWIADGFHQRGFDIDAPPTPEQTPRLLALLGDAETKPSVSGAVPEYMKYNAFRCLRDSGFEAVRFAISNRTLSAEVERGLVAYYKMEHRWPAASSVGILAFGHKEEESDGDGLPPMLQPRFQIVAQILVFAPFLLGAGLMVWSFRHARKKLK